jgi:hypothetical protein
MKNHRSIEEFRQQVNLYFDHALSNDEEKEFLQQVSNDPKCSKVFNKEKSFRDFIKTNVTRPAVSPDLIQTIKDKVRVI